MPHIYTSDDVEITTKQTAAILRCLELVESRIRYVSAEYQEILINHEEYNRNFLVNYAFPILNITIPPAIQEYILEDLNSKKYQHEHAELYKSDLDHMLKILKMLKELYEGKGDGLLIACQLLINCKTSKGSDDYVMRVANAQINEAQKLYNAVLLENKKDKKNNNVKAAQEQLDKCCLSQSFQRAELERTSDFKFYSKIFNILKSEVFGEQEKKLKDYINIEFNSFTMNASLQLNETTFNSLVAANRRILDTTVKAINERHANAAKKYPEHAEYFKIEAGKFLYDNGIEVKLHYDYSNLDSLIEMYRNNLSFKTRISEINDQDQESIASELVYLQSEDKAKRAAQNSLKKAEAQRTQLAAKEEALKQALQAKIFEEEKIRLKKVQKDQMSLDNSKRKGERDAKLAKREMEKMLRHKDLIAKNKLITNKEAQITRSIFKISMDLVMANVEQLRELFEPHLTKYKYDALVTLVKRLGGSVEEGTGSSHKYIYFSGTIYQEFEDWLDTNAESVHIETKGSISKPHGQAKGNALYHHNLRLARDAIEKVLPDNWLQLVAVSEQRADRKPGANKAYS